jgi:hypothetical protein
MNEEEEEEEEEEKKKKEKKKKLKHTRERLFSKIRNRFLTY